MHRMERVNSLYSEKSRAVQEVLGYFFCSCCCTCVWQCPMRRTDGRGRTARRVSVRRGSRRRVRTFVQPFFPKPIVLSGGQRVFSWTQPGQCLNSQQADSEFSVRFSAIESTPNSIGDARKRTGFTLSAPLSLSTSYIGSSCRISNPGRHCLSV